MAPRQGQNIWIALNQKPTDSAADWGKWKIHCLSWMPPANRWVRWSPRAELSHEAPKAFLLEKIECSCLTSPDKEMLKMSEKDVTGIWPSVFVPLKPPQIGCSNTTHWAIAVALHFCKQWVVCHVYQNHLKTKNILYTSLGLLVIESAADMHMQLSDSFFCLVWASSFDWGAWPEAQCCCFFSAKPFPPPRWQSRVQTGLQGAV